MVKVYLLCPKGSLESRIHAPELCARSRFVKPHRRLTNVRERCHLVLRLSVIRRFPKTALTPGTEVKCRVSAGIVYTDLGTVTRKPSRRASLEEGARARVVVPMEELVTRIYHSLR